MAANLKARLVELIGAPRRMAIRQINSYTPSRDNSTADYRFWDRARRGKARGLEVSGLLLKPLASKVAAWALGDAVIWDAGRSSGAGRISALLNDWWAAHHAGIVRAYEESLGLGDCYLVVNADLSLTVVPPHVVDPLLDGRGEIVGWRISESANLTPDPSPLHGEGRNNGASSPLSTQWRGAGQPQVARGEVTVIDTYTATTRTRQILRGGVTVATEKYANLIGMIPVIHIANRGGADETFGRPEGDALIPALQRYGDVIDAAVRGNIRQGRPTPVIEKLGTADQVRKFWEQFGRRETQTLPDGSTEALDVIDFDPDQLLTLGGEAQFRYAQPGSFSKDAETLLNLLFYLIVQHSEMPEAVWGASIPSSRASADTQMQPFVKWITKKRGLAASWMIALSRVVLGYASLIDWRIDPQAPLDIRWSALTEEDGRLRLDTVAWAHGAGVIGDDEAKQMLAGEKQPHPPTPSP